MKLLTIVIILICIIVAFMFLCIFRLSNQCELTNTFESNYEGNCKSSSSSSVEWIDKYLNNEVVVRLKNGKTIDGYLLRSSIKDANSNNMLIECYAIVNCQNDSLFTFIKTGDVLDLTIKVNEQR